MRTFNYSTVHFPFHKFLDVRYKFDELAYDIDQWKLRIEGIQNDEFNKLYSNFVKYCQPFFENSGLKPLDSPKFRVHDHRHKSWGFGNLYKITGKSKVVYVPLTPLFGTNSFTIESKPFLEDFNIVELKIGQFTVIEYDKNIIDEFVNQSGLASVCMMVIFNPDVP